MTLAALVLALSPFAGAGPPSGSLIGPSRGVVAPAKPIGDEPIDDEPIDDEPIDDEPDDSGLQIPDEEDLAQAGDAFNRGVQAFKEERYEDALRHFSRAQQLAPHPDTLYNLGLTQQQMGQHLEAWRSFEALLEQSTDDKERQDLLSMRAISRAQISGLKVVVDPPRKVCLDGAPMPRQDDQLQVLTTPGPHRLDIDRDRRWLDLQGGETRMLQIELRPETPPPPPRRRLRVLSGLAIGGAAAAAGLGLGAGLSSDERLRLGLGVGAATAGVLAVTTTVIALVVHRRMRQWTPPPPHDPCPDAER